MCNLHPESLFHVLDMKAASANGFCSCFQLEIAGRKTPKKNRLICLYLTYMFAARPCKAIDLPVFQRLFPGGDERSLSAFMVASTGCSGRLFRYPRRVRVCKLCLSTKLPFIWICYCRESCTLFANSFAKYFQRALRAEVMAQTLKPMTGWRGTSPNSGSEQV